MIYVPGTVIQATYNPQVSTGGSVSVSNANLSYLSVPANAVFTLGTNNHTVEFWMYQTARGAYDTVFTYNSGASGPAVNNYYFNAGTNQFYLILGNGGGFNTTTNLNGSPPSLNAWHHYAIVRNSDTFTLYVDGTSQGSFTVSQNITAQTGPMWIGGQGVNGQNGTGYITNFRYVNGTAVYTANFTPPTAPLTAISNTQLLLLESSSGGLLTDSSVNNFTVTNVNTASYIASTPFTPTGGPPSAPISVKTSFVSNSLAGSLQFTGGATSHSAPYLSLVPGISIAGGAYTVEGWFQLPNFSQAYGIMGANASAGMSLFIVNNTAFTTDSYGGLGQRTYTVPTMLPNVWYYFALTRNAGQTETLFLGSATSTLAYKATAAAGGTSVSGGQQTNTLNYGANPTNDIGTYYGQAWPGYLTNIRATVGTSVYDPTQASIPVPNAPLSIVTNTQYLMLGSSVTGDASGTQTVTNHSVNTSVLKPLLTTVIGTPLKIISTYR
jgi:hypothetical protein